MRFRLAYIATSSLSPTTISKVPPLPQLEPPKTTGSITNTDNNQSPFDQDSIFNEWCHQMGIQCPHAAVRTGPESVAGRGVFATSNVNEGDVVISIPYDLALTQENAARFFPELEEELVRCRRRIMSGNDGRENGKRDHVVQRFWSKVFRRTNSLSSAAIDTKFNPDDFWQAELTAYALAALDANHPWSTWISQWLRDDPLQTLVDQQQDNTLIHYEYDEQGIRDAVENFHDMAPQIPKYKIDAAVRIRLHELQQYIQNYQSTTTIKKKDESSNDCIPISKSMYTTLISRAIGLSDTITACLPMHDMINHSNEPNLGFTFCDGNFEMVALRDIGEGEELFLEYMDVSREEETDGGRVRVAEWDEDKATWLLAQWGIPSKPETTKKEKDDEADLKRLESMPIL